MALPFLYLPPGGEVPPKGAEEERRNPKYGKKSQQIRNLRITARIPLQSPSVTASPREKLKREGQDPPLQC